MAEVRWHIGKNDIPRECKAKGECPLGGEHFPTRQDAYRHIQDKSKKENKILPSFKSSDTRGNKRNVIKRITDPKVIARYEGFKNPTLHAKEDSISNRMKCVDLDAKRLAYYEVDKGHRNGLEVHCLQEDGSILIYNKNTERFITVFLSRPGQLDKYVSDDLKRENQEAVNRMYECAELNLFTQANKINGDWYFDDDEVRVYNNLKQEIFNK